MSDVNDIEKETIESAEMYANILREIKELLKEIGWSEDDIASAKRYANAICKANKMHCEKNWTEDDIQEVERYAATLKEIEEREIEIEN